MVEGEARAAWAAFRRVRAEPLLRRVVLAYMGHNASEYGTWVAILVYAYAVTGPASVGLVATAQLLPPALASPVVGGLGDRFGRLLVLRASYGLQAVMLGATGLAMLLELAPILVYLLAVSACLAMAPARPMQGALMPGLVRTPADLTAANAASGMAEATGILAGPMVAGAILAVSRPAVVFLAASVLLLLVSLRLWGARDRADQAAASPAAERAPAAVALSAPGNPGEEPELSGLRLAWIGLRILATRPPERLLAAILFGRDLVFGALDVLLVLLAIEILRIGQSGAGYLNAFLGLGGIAGGAAALGIVGARGLPRLLVMTALGWAVAMVAIAGLPSVLSAIPLLAVAGLSLAMMDVVARTLLQRFTPERTLGGVFGAIEGLNLVAEALGALLVSVAVAALGVAGAFGLAGIGLPALAVAALPRLTRAEDQTTLPVAEIALLRGLSLFAPVPPPALEGAARRLRLRQVPAGTTIIREGDPGDVFYVIVRGAVEVSQGGRPLRTLGPAESFGEIALLRRVPRTATVTATLDTELLALARDDFLLTLTGTPHAIAEAERTTETILAEDRRRVKEAKP
jgi:MFS family permease